MAKVPIVSLESSQLLNDIFTLTKDLLDLTNDERKRYALKTNADKLKNFFNGADSPYKTQAELMNKAREYKAGLEKAKARLKSQEQTQGQGKTEEAQKPKPKEQEQEKPEPKEKAQENSSPFPDFPDEEPDKNHNARTGVCPARKSILRRFVEKLGRTFGNIKLRAAKNYKSFSDLFEDLSNAKATSKFNAQNAYGGTAYGTSSTGTTYGTGSKTTTSTTYGGNSYSSSSAGTTYAGNTSTSTTYGTTKTTGSGTWYQNSTGTTYGASSAGASAGTTGTTGTAGATQTQKKGGFYGFGHKVGSAVGFVTEKGMKVAEAAREAAKKAAENAKKAAENAKKAAQEAGKKIREGAKNTWSRAKQGAKNAWGNVKNAAKDFGQGVKDGYNQQMGGNQNSTNQVPNNSAPNNSAPNNSTPNNSAPNNSTPNNSAPNNQGPNKPAPNQTTIDESKLLPCQKQLSEEEKRTIIENDLNAGLTENQKDYEECIKSTNTEIIQKIDEFKEKLQKMDASDQLDALRDFVDNAQISIGDGDDHYKFKGETEPMFDDEYRLEPDLYKEDLLNIVDARYKDSKDYLRQAKENLGEGFIQNCSDTERNKNIYESERNTGKHQEFTMNNGEKVSYASYNYASNTAVIDFGDKPLEDIKYKGGGFMKNDGRKVSTAEPEITQVQGVRVKLNKYGKVDFSLPENKDLLSHPTILQKLVEMYPSSFQSVPTTVFATDPKAFMDSLQRGIEQQVKAGASGLENSEIYENALKAVKQKTNSMQSSFGKDGKAAYNEASKDAAKAAAAKFEEQIKSQMGGE